MSNSTAQKAIQIHPSDNVFVSLQDVKKGEQIKVNSVVIEVQEDIPSGHKMAASKIMNGSNVVKFGYPIGHATRDIVAGEHIHTHNMRTNLSGQLEYTYSPEGNKAFDAYEANIPTFLGYTRENGDVGVRNEIWIINTVGCINKTSENLAILAEKQIKIENIDGIQHFSHPYGCSQLGDDLKYTQKILADLIHHPNAGGVLVLGLGCENNYIDLFKNEIGDYNPNRVKFLSVQQVEDEMELGLELISELAEYASAFSREEVPVSKLKVGLKCGGSDGLSGITANPLVGAFSDMLVKVGGATVLTEVPEMFGAETILMDRAKDEAVFTKIVHLVNDFKQYFIKYEQPVYENPSPGNKKGGITTLEEKSLGCVQKGGFAPILDVLDYGERLRETGLHLLQGPGNDLVSVTALAAAGCQIVLFTTGRGTPFGGPVPTVKISTNTALAEHKKNWIDYNAGVLIGDEGMDNLSDHFFQYILDVASGKRITNNERFGFKEIAIFKDGVTM
ncbi:altronate hydrolase [Bacillus sp. M6-12]|uniref:UxaA family hydrolase n=1 Tax=Bacillus sp. M6-12 TaxID=2054166 RepID=UPI000C770C8C|nr:altronate dehydratase family protein [Bacillus sp. M6-12]PLS17704.1 altronate hydrolase [Bacillus sp. M6-12]